MRHGLGGGAKRGPDLLSPGVVTGIGVAGTLDEVVLHQLLHWHHFYDRSFAADMISDGLFHLASTAFLVVGLYWAMASVWRGRDADRDRAGAWRRFWAGLLLGAGGFNLFDGTVQHKVLRLHEVRMDAADPLPYDIAFLGLAVVVALAGVVLLRRSSLPSAPDSDARL
jgi:uncharacterized membrane protein